MSLEVFAGYYEKPDIYLRHVKLFQEGEITRTFASDWGGSLCEELTEMTGLDITAEAPKNIGGQSWDRDLFPTHRYNPSVVGFYNARTCIYICVGGQRELRAHYNLLYTHDRSSAVMALVREETDETILTQRIARTYPMNHSTTAPPLAKIPYVKQVIVKHVLGKGLIRNGVSLARCMDCVGALDKATRDVLYQYDTERALEAEARERRLALERELKVFADLCEIERQRAEILANHKLGTIRSHSSDQA